MRTMGRVIVLLVAMVTVLALIAAAPAYANNDPKSPGDDCSGNPTAIGQPPSEASPVGTNATDNPGDTPSGDQVDGPASEDNPGSSEGAAGQGNFDGAARC